MKRTLALLVTTTALMAAGAGAARAETVTNDTTTINYAGFVPCANGGAGEILIGTIDVHNLVTSTVNGNTVSSQFHFQPQGGSLVGVLTGDTYRLTGSSHGSSRESLDTDHYVLTYVNNYNLIGPGPGNNLRVHEIAHVNIDRNEDVTVDHDSFTIDCG